jgi:hypothetical protein
MKKHKLRVFQYTDDDQKILKKMEKCNKCKTNHKKCNIKDYIEYSRRRGCANNVPTEQSIYRITPSFRRNHKTFIRIFLLTFTFTNHNLKTQRNSSLTYLTTPSIEFHSFQDSQNIHYDFLLTLLLQIIKKTKKL